MSNESQQARFEELQSGEQSGAPFDDTAISNARFELQLVLNEDRLKSTYYSFRSMSEIGNVEIRYSAQATWEERAEAGYVLVGGRVSSVGREVNVRDAVYPAVQIQFEDMFRLGEERPVYTSSKTPPSKQRGGPGVGQELRAIGEGRIPEDKAFVARFYAGWADGKRINPRLGDVPSTLREYDRLQQVSIDDPKGEPEAWALRTNYVQPVVETVAAGSRAVWVWNDTEDRYQKSKLANPIETIQQKTQSPNSTFPSDTTPV